MDIKVLGLDLSKAVCSLAGLDEAGAIVFHKRLQRHRLPDFLDKLPPVSLLWKPAAGCITSAPSAFCELLPNRWTSFGVT